MVVRLPTTFFSMAGAGLTTKERLFIAMAWTPKATVQAVLGAAPLDAIITNYGHDAPEVAYGACGMMGEGRRLWAATRG